MHIAERFEVLLAAHPHRDGRAWSGQEIDEATGGVVTRSYVTNLRKGRIENPGYEKLRAIAKAVGFAPELWFEEDLVSGSSAWVASDRDRATLPEKVAHLMQTPASETSRKAYADADVARLSFGVLSEEDVRAIRTVALPDPSGDQIMGACGRLWRTPFVFPQPGKDASAYRPGGDGDSPGRNR